MPIVILKVRSEELIQTIFIKGPACLLGPLAGSAQSADGCAICRFSSIRGLRRAIERNLQIAQIQQLHTTRLGTPNILIVCSFFRGVTWSLCVCSESINDVTDNAKNNFGDPLNYKYIACARSVSENVGLLLKNSYKVSDSVYLLSFLGNAFVPR